MFTIVINEQAKIKKNLQVPVMRTRKGKRSQMEGSLILVKKIIKRVKE